MTQENKELLLKDLCARLPYGVKFACNKNVYTAKGLDLIVTDEGDWEYAVTAKGIAPIEIDFIKPYLFPMSSMSDEQLPYYITTLKYSEEARGMVETPNSFDWLNKNHYDYRGLIPMGLAEDATDKNIYRIYG
jgi:hypothetical protein